MIAVIRSDLYRLATTRSSASSLSAISICGCTAWIVFVEAMYGKLQEPLPFSAYVDAASGNLNKLLLLLGWTLAAIAGAVVAVRRDLNGD
jgi:hypothetical protein